MSRSVYLFSDGCLRRKDNTLVFEGAEGNRYLPVQNIHEIYLFGNVELTKSLLEFCAQKEILLHIFNSEYDYYMGTFYPREHLNAGYVTVKQAEHYLDPHRRMQLARRFVEGAAKNMLAVLRYYHNRGKDVADRMALMENLLERVEDVLEIPELMALEGNIREHYYHAFDAILENQDFVFERRTRRPPRNELNTLISFGNAILYSTVLREAYKTHLDPRIGYLHTTNFHRFSLNLDVAEIFKPLLVDRVIFTVIGKRMITKRDFEAKLQGLALKESGRKTWITEWTKRLDTTIRHRSVGREVSYRTLIRMELYKVEKHVVEGIPYRPFVTQW
ncbi:type I-B CRISPR-associated endonuclease Cas1b [Alicyclobacillus macrosporangiidus]|uniref:CRISPR-associated endonuclease Cas1 n=1 Tax=Alicyclobacillus macrosporangiidus TaxID=392015 RepID=A0A1I7K475_9BACL|nr:type I-B CRISPR-associated endonuclease Cas1b [Alicyclobacillus macrosporangiidus]SFU92263.1 CRISP-associated protein Cas1 [Alicyclobacillus macrosporangiidus]